jgi:hypothetical protein
MTMSLGEIGWLGSRMPRLIRPSLAVLLRGEARRHPAGAELLGGWFLNSTRVPTVLPAGHLEQQQRVNAVIRTAAQRQRCARNWAGTTAKCQRCGRGPGQALSSIRGRCSLGMFSGADRSYGAADSTDWRRAEPGDVPAHIVGNTCSPRSRQSCSWYQEN